MSASNVAAEKVLRLCEQSWGRAHPESEPVLPAEAAALIAAEYAPLVAAVKAILAAKDETELIYEDAYDFLKKGPWAELRKSVTHIEGDATP